MSLRKMRDFSWSNTLYLLCGILKSSSNCCDTGLSTITKLNSRCTVINASTISRVMEDVLWSLCPTLSRILGLTSLPYARKPSTDTGKYMEITPMYAQNTERGNLDAFLMSVWIVGKVDAPPNENRIVPNARRITEHEKYDRMYDTWTKSGWNYKVQQPISNSTASEESLASRNKKD